MAVLAFHKIEPSLTIGINNYHPKRFEGLLSNFITAGYRFIDLDSYLEREYHKEKTAVITFDDGYESFFTTAFPILQKLNIPATVFIPTAFIGQNDNWDYAAILRPSKHMSSQQIREMADCDITIGSHGRSHRSLADMSSRLLKLELEHSKKDIEEITGKKVRYLSYPFGRFTAEVETRALEAGYERGFTLASYRKSRLGFTVSRLGIYTIDTPLSVTAKINGGMPSKIEKFKGAIINAYASGTILLHRLRAGQYPD
ncbi:MAG: polysaccharide deacetylase family protein [candidate division Zixibacteria bacterium]|nr:polysaccharide deacetylase family protein [candidate division Zixibacteria bacterium]